jgi:hypothetical protein
MADLLSVLPPSTSSPTSNPEAAGAAAAAKAAAAAVAAVNVGAVGTALSPAIAVCPNGEEVLLACDNAAAFFSPNGVPSRRYRQAFSVQVVCHCAARNSSA